MDIYTHTKEKLIRKGESPEMLESLALSICHSKNLNAVHTDLKTFVEQAHQLPWPQDHDFGALVLQKFASEATDNIALLMLNTALELAQYCASCATSGGEGLARAQHVKELSVAIAQYEPSD